MVYLFGWYEYLIAIDFMHLRVKNNIMSSKFSINTKFMSLRSKHEFSLAALIVHVLSFNILCIH